MKDLKANSSPDIKIFLIGDKADLEEERVVSKEQGLEKAKKLGIDFFTEVSTKKGFNPQELFIEAGKILYGDYIKYKFNHQSKFKLDKLNKYIDF